jgi:hypothetical protein
MCLQFLPKGLAPLLPKAGFEVEVRLADFRREYEKEGGDLSEELPFLLVLTDVCLALGLSESARARVLGPRGVALLQEWEQTPVTLRVPGGDGDSLSEAQ